MSSVSAVSVGMISSFLIDSICSKDPTKSHPCKHCCSIVLNDGRERTVKLSSVEVYVVISKIAKDQGIIKNPWGHKQNHFSKNLQYQYNELTHEFDKVDLPSPEEVLRSIFIAHTIAQDVLQ